MNGQWWVGRGELGTGEDLHIYTLSLCFLVAVAGREIQFQLVRNT